MIVLAAGFVSLAVIAALGWTRSAPPPQVWKEPLVVEARGTDFQWWFRYAGQDGELYSADDVLTGTELHIPSGTNVVLRLESSDYLYAFSVPELKLKEIAVPELTYELPLRVTQPGSYALPADPLCGFRFLHDDTMGRMVVQSPAEFNHWLTTQSN